MILAPEPNEYVSYHRTFYGIQVVLHNPDDFPEVNTPIIVQPDYDIKILIEPTILISDQTVWWLEHQAKKFQMYRFYFFIFRSKTYQQYKENVNSKTRRVN